jgi:hypothetical protein
VTTSTVKRSIWEEIADRTDDDLDPKPDLAEEIGIESIGGKLTKPDRIDGDRSANKLQRVEQVVNIYFKSCSSL